MRIPVRMAVTVSVAMLSLTPSGQRLQASTLRNLQGPERSPLDIAKVLAATYPAQPIMSYIPALSWSGALRLTRLTKDSQFADKARREMQPLISGETPAIAEPGRRRE